MRYRGRAVLGFDLGASPASPPAAALQKVQVDLQNQVVAVQWAGDVDYAQAVGQFSLDFSDAVTRYQAAASAGATSVGPEIAALGVPATTALTNKAYAIDLQLQALTKSGSAVAGRPAYFNQSDADKAKALVVDVVSAYQQAIAVAASASGESEPSPPPPNLPPPPPPPATASTSSALPIVLGLTVVVGVALIATRVHP